MKFFRKDLFPTWQSFTRKLKKDGGVVEADPDLFKIGTVAGIGFISPNGDVSVQGTVDCLNDAESESIHAYLAPAQMAPPSTIINATKSMGNVLFSKHGVYGYFTVYFTSHFDLWENIPRISGERVCLGLSAPSCGQGILAIIAARTPGYKPDVGESDDETIFEQIPSLFPGPFDIMVPKCPTVSVKDDRIAGANRTNLMNIAKGIVHPIGSRAMVHIPICFHSPLMNIGGNETFYRNCEKRGLMFNRATRTGVILLHLNTVERGVFGIICMHETRSRTLEQAILALTIIYEYCGKEVVTVISEGPESSDEPIHDMDIPAGSDSFRLVRLLGALKILFKQERAVAKAKAQAKILKDLADAEAAKLTEEEAEATECEDEDEADETPLIVAVPDKEVL